MNGDISRVLFDPTKDYTSVRHQQGRVVVDADHNEQVDIGLYDTRAARTDIIGHSGTHQDNDGFAVSAAGATLTVGAGRYYVEGIRLENPAACTLDTQPHLPVFEGPTEPGAYLVYLDVWERPINAVQDPEIREVALGGPDTTTRTRAVWQAKLLRLGEAEEAIDCATGSDALQRLVDGSTGTLEVRLQPAAQDPDPCIASGDAGYRGTENQLYRVEIHDGNFDAADASGVNGDVPTFKWSRDNGAVVAAWTDLPGAVSLTVDRLGPGGVDGLSAGDHVELVTDTTLLTGTPGLVAEIAEAPQGSTVVLSDPDETLAAELAALFDADAHPMLRRWDSDGARPVDPAELDSSELGEDDWIRVEDGIEIRFDPSLSYRSGDFWLIPARTAVLPGTEDQQLDWPLDGDGEPLAEHPHGPEHRYARLAVAVFDGETWTVTDDCRPIFVSLTQTTQLQMRGGDGQQARSGDWLPRPLIVGVSRGSQPVVDAVVAVTIAEGDGRLSATEPAANGGTAGSLTLSLTTDGQGLAQFWWRLGAAPTPVPFGDTYTPERGQLVEVNLPASGGAITHQPLRFGATAVDDVGLEKIAGDAQLGRPGETLPLALRVQVTEGETPMPGALVAFRVLNRRFHGQALNEDSGGSVHASANRVSQQNWPNGSRAMEVIVRTGADGVAQVQWMLGNDPRVNPQRVKAALLDASGADSDQHGLFHAELNLASEVFFDVRGCPAMEAEMPTISQQTVQRAIELLCGASAPTAPMVTNPRYTYTLASTGETGSAALSLAAPLSVAQSGFTGLLFDRTFNRATVSNLSPPFGTAARAGLRVFVELPQSTTTSNQTGITAWLPIGLDGTVSMSQRTSTLGWTIGAVSLASLQAALASAGSVLLRAVIIPALIPGSTVTDQSLRYEFAQWLAP